MSDNNAGNVLETEMVANMTVETRRNVLPSIVTRIVLGASLSHNNEKKETVVIVDDIGNTIISMKDFVEAREIASMIWKEYEFPVDITAHMVLKIRDRAFAILESRTDERAGKKGILMLKDGSGCGYWRMSLPARYMDREGIYIDITGGSMDYDQLLEYDVIVVQRLHSWDSFNILERIKNAGRRIVYDIDDDIFCIPSSNPASRSFGDSELMAAVECMKLADVVTVTTPILQERIMGMLGGRSPIVIPNALNVDEGWMPTPFIGSPDGYRRIFWQGSNTHDEDWVECFEAVRMILKKHKNVRLVLMGFLPTLVRDVAVENNWHDRIEYIEPMDTEAYFKMVKKIRADVGLAPLKLNSFNEGKSPIKWIENSMIGMPTVASDVGPYRDNISNGKDGFLCNSTAEWFEAIEKCILHPAIVRSMVENARTKIRNEFNIKSVSGTWKDIILGR